jgi:hypothetical protein
LGLISYSEWKDIFVQRNRDNSIIYDIIKLSDCSQKQEDDKKESDLYVEVVINTAMALKSS